MIAEYKCKISGDTSQLLKSIKEAKGELKQLNDDEVLIKLNYDGNLKEFNKVFDQVSKSNPQIAVQFQYDINKKILEEELDKLKDMSVELDTDNIKKQMKTLGQDILKINEEWIDDIEEETDAYDRLIKSTQNMLNLQKQLESSGEDGNKALSDLGNTIKEIITEVSKSEGLTGKIINTKNLDAQNQKIIYLKNTLAELKKQGAVDATGQDFVQNANESTRALDKLKNSFAEYRKINGDKNLKNFWKELKYEIDSNDESAKQLVSDLRLLNEETQSIDTINNGGVKKGGINGLDTVLLASTNGKKRMDEIEEIRQRLSMLGSEASSVAKTIDYAYDTETDTLLEIQEKAKGAMLGQVDWEGNGFVNPEIFEATNKQISEMIQNLWKLNKAGIGVDFNLENVFFDKDKGFSFIDIDTSTAVTEYANFHDFLEDLKMRFFSDIECFYENANDIDGSKLTENFKKTFDDIGNQVSKMVDVAEKATADAQDSHSPSLVAEKLGEYWGEGYAQGILKHKDDVENAIRELVNSGIITAQQLLDDMPNIFGDIDYTDLVDPVRNVLSENFDKSGNIINKSDISLGIENDIDNLNNKIVEFKKNQDEITDSDIRNGYEKMSDEINTLGEEYNESEEYAKLLLDAVQKISDVHKELKPNLVDGTVVSEEDINKLKEVEDILKTFPELYKFADNISDIHWTLSNDIGEDWMDSWFDFLDTLPKAKEFMTMQGSIADFVNFDDSVKDSNVSYFDKELTRLNEEMQRLTDSSDNFIVKYKEIVDLIQSGKINYNDAFGMMLEKEFPNYKIMSDLNGYNLVPKSKRELEELSIAAENTEDSIVSFSDKIKSLKSNETPVSTNSIKDFYKNYGTPSDALDKGYFANMSEVIDELGGKFKELNDEKDLFSESKINTAFLKELSEELGVTGDAAKVLFREFDNIDLYTSDFGQKISGKQGAFSNVAKSVEKIKSILDGTYIITDEDISNAENLLRIIRETEDKKNDNTDVVSRESLEQTESELNVVNERLSETESSLEDSRKYAESLEQELAETTNQAKELADAMERIDKLQDQLQEERNYSSNAFDAQIVAETKNDELQKENDKLEEEISRLNNELANKQNIELSNKEADVSVNEGLREEKQLLEDLGAELNNVIQKVQGKTNEFEVERATVLQVVDDEINSLKELEGQLENIIKKASKIKIKIDVPENIDANINLGIDKLDPQIAKLREAVENIQEILSVLRDFKLGDASKLGTLFKNLSSVEWNKIKIPKSFVENLGNLVTGTAYLDKDNLNKLKNFLNAIVKIDLSTVGKNLNSVADGLASIINQIKDADTISALSDLKDTIQVLNKTGKLKDINDKDKSKKESQKKITEDNQKTIDNFENQYSSIIRKLNVLRNDTTIKLNAEGYEKVRNNIDNLENEIERLSKIDTSSMTKEEIANIQLQIDIAKNSIKELKNEYKVANSAKTGNILETLSKALEKNGKYSKEARLQIREYYNEILSTDGQISAKRLNEILSAFQRIDAAERDAGRAGESFGQGLLKRIKSVTQSAIAMSFSFYDIIRYARETVGVVTELDSALTELRKVSDASPERLAQSFEKSADTAKELGSTISDVINATSDWARMGYDISDAEELARVATLFQNVGDNMTADSANSYLISTLQGFQMSADQAEEIVDKYNEVANHFAIDTCGIGEALQQSAASLNAANTDLSKSIALVTTANITQQNPEVVGTAFKTLSARIRGAKTELEDLGEEEDEFTQTTSKLRDLVQALTGFDIMEDEDTYKDIYEIMVGIGKEWEHLSDIEKQSLAESLAGKRNVNVFYSVMNHIDDLEKAYQTAENSAGSAEKEQENYAKSIQYSIDQAKASLQELAHDVLSSQLVKGVVDLFTTIVQGLDKIIDHPLMVLLLGGGIGSIFGFIKSNKSETPVGGILGDIINLTKATKEYAKAKVIATAADQAHTEAEKKGVIAGTAEQMQDLANSEANLQAASTKLVTSLKGKINDLKSLPKLIVTTVKGIASAFPILTMLGVAVAASGVAAYVSYKYFNRYNEALDNAKKSAEEAQKDVSDIESKLSNVKSQIDAIKSDGVITITEQADLDRLEQENKALELQLKYRKIIADEKNQDVVDAAKDKWNNDFASTTSEADTITYGQMLTGANGMVGAGFATINADTTQKTKTERVAEAYSKALESQQKAQSELDKATEIAIEDGRTTEEEREQIAELTAKEKDRSEELKLQRKNRQEQLDAIQEQIDNLSLTKDGIESDEYKQALEQQKYLISVDPESTAAWNEMQISSVISSLGLSEEDLRELAKEAEKSIPDDLMSDYNKELAEAIKLGYLDEDYQFGDELAEVVIGNIDTAQRKVLDWNKENVNKFSDALLSWGENPEDYLGSYSTVDSRSADFDGVEIAFTPIFLGENGPEYLDSDTVYNYIDGLIKQANSKGLDWKNDESVLLNLDKKENGGKGLLFGQDLNGTEVISHLAGKYGSLASMQNEMNKYTDGSVLSNSELVKSLDEESLILDENQDKISIVNQYLNAYKTSAEEAAEATKDFNGILSGVQGLSTGFDQIGKIYADVQNGEEFDYSSILNNEQFSNAFSGYKEEYDAFIKTVSESPDDINACQSAFNNLATAYVYGSKVLDDLTEETAEATEHMLTYMGVTNASEVVQNALNTGVRAEAAAWELLAQLQERGISAKQQATQSTDKYISVIGTEIQALATEKGYSESTTKALYAMYIQQLMATNNPFNSAKSVEQLGILIRALGQATQAYADFQNYQHFALMSLDTKRSKNEQKWYGAWAKAYENKLRKTNYVDQVEVGTSPAISYAAPPSFGSGDSGSSSGGSDSAKEFSEEIDWIEIKISRLQRDIDNFDKKVSATWKNWTERTQALNGEFFKTLDLTNQQTNAFWRYLQQAESVGLPEAYKQLVQNGTIDISTITDEGLKDQIDQYQQWYEKALQAADAIDDLKQSVVDLVNVNFEGIQKRFDQAVSSIEHSINMIQKSEDLLTAKGYKSATSFYSWQNDAINANQNNLLQERSELTSLMNAATNGFVDATSEQYKEWQSSIDEIDEQLKDNEITIAENTQAIRDLIEEYFDYNITQIDRINSEADFIKNIMSYSQLTDKKGNFTNEGWSSMAMSGIKYNVYMEEADKYAAKIAEYTRLLNDDPYNVDINDQLNDYVDKQRDAINNALSATDEIKDMVSDMLNELLDNLSKAADKYMNEINSEKNLFDYQRDIQSKTDEISGYQKQINSLSGDDSEENRARLQQLRENLATSREDLQQTEYERWITDQQSMLDNMQDEAQAWVTQYLDEFQNHLSEWIGQINTNQENIKTTVTNEVNDLGADLSNSMTDILTKNGENTLIKAYNDNFGTDVHDAIQNINNYIKGLQQKAEEEARAAAEAERQRIAQQQAAQAQAAAQAAAQAQAAQAQAGGAGWGSWFVQKQDNYPKNRLNTETSIVDRLKYHNIASDMGHRAAYYSAMGGGGSYRGTDAQNVWMIQQMKLHGYYKGGKNISDELAWTQEKGAEIIRRSDGALLTPVKGATVFSNGQTEALWSLSKLMTNSINTASLPNSISHYSSGTVNNDMKISFNLPNVSNYQEFVAQLKSDGSFEKFIQQATIGNALGKNTLLKNRY